MAIGRTPPESFSEAMSEEESNNLRAQSSKSPFTMSSTSATRPARQSASPTKALMSSPVQPDGPGAEPFATLRITSPDKTTPSTWMRGAESGKIGEGAPEEGGCSLRKDSTVEGTNGKTTLEKT